MCECCIPHLSDYWITHLPLFDFGGLFCRLALAAATNTWSTPRRFADEHSRYAASAACKCLASTSACARVVCCCWSLLLSSSSLLVLLSFIKSNFVPTRRNGTFGQVRFTNGIQNSSSRVREFLSIKLKQNLLFFVLVWRLNGQYFFTRNNQCPRIGAATFGYTCHHHLLLCPKSIVEMFDRRLAAFELCCRSRSAESLSVATLFQWKRKSSKSCQHRHHQQTESSFESLLLLSFLILVCLFVFDLKLKKNRWNWKTKFS